MPELFQREVLFKIGDLTPLPPSAHISAQLFSAHRFTEAISASRAARHSDLTSVENMGDQTILHHIALLDIEADAWAHLRNFDQAIQVGEQMICLIDRLSKPALQQKLLPSSHLSLGHYLYENASYQTAIAHYQKVVEANPAPDNARKSELEACLADCQANLGNLQAATIHAKQAIAYLVNSPIQPAPEKQLLLQERLAFYHAWQGQVELALNESDQILHIQRKLAAADSAGQYALARHLDHRAEILERGKHYKLALASAQESVELRLAIFAQHAEETLPHLHSLVTLARLQEKTKLVVAALNTCDHARQILATNSSEGALPEILGQLLHTIGRCHLQNKQYDAAELALKQSLHIFQKQARTSKASVHLEAQANIVTDLLRLHRSTNRQLSRHYSLRALALKYRIARQGQHAIQYASLGRSLLRHGRIQLAADQHDAAHRTLERAAQIFHTAQVLPPGFPRLASQLSELILSSRTDTKYLARVFFLLIETLARTTEVLAPLEPDTLLTEIKHFCRIWAKHFLEHQEHLALVALIGFTHGRRLALLADAELRSRQNSGQELNQDEALLVELSSQIHRIDLQSKGILRPISTDTSGRTNLQHDYADRIHQHRQKLYQDFLNCRERLVEAGKLPPATSIPTLNELCHKLPDNVTVAIWCHGATFGLPEYPPRVILVRNGAPVEIKECAEVLQAHESFERLLSKWHFGRSGTRGALPSKLIGSNADGIDETTESALLQDAMRQIWAKLSAQTFAQPIQKKLHLITHAETHNLPWLSACPEYLSVSQYPSLHFYLSDQKTTSYSPTPNKVEPVVILTAPETEPAETLYFAKFERVAIEYIWPGATRHMSVQQASNALPTDKSAAIWMIGHGNVSTTKPVSTDATQFTHSRILSTGSTGLIYASTCYLGRTDDVFEEPVGLPSLIALRPDTPFVAGSLAPVDDLGAALLALLFHHFWKETEHSRSAFNLARHTLASGCWPEAAIKIVHAVAEVSRDCIVAKAKAHAHISSHQINALYPELHPAERLRKQYAIRRQGRYSIRLLEMLLNPPELNALLALPNITNSSRYWTWFG
jgi:tetratricopeptide (TPR) repeat protein